MSVFENVRKCLHIYGSVALLKWMENIFEGLLIFQKTVLGLALIMNVWMRLFQSEDSVEDNDP